MKIKIPFIEVQTDEKCPCNDYKEYELKLKCMRTKLHSKYIACISIGIVIWIIATGQANTEQFADWISFASTITSIILSVIAIILSITGEGKTDAVRDKIEEAVKKLEKTANDIENANSDSVKNINEVKREIVSLKESLKDIPGKTVEQMQVAYGLSNAQANTTQNSDKGWL